MKSALTLILLFVISTSFGQIESKTYAKKLKGLLSHTVPEVGVQEVSDLDKNVVFLDAREKKEFNVSHIKNAIWVGYDDFDRLKAIAKDKRIVVYCSVGYRSEKIAEKLIKNGYQDVSNLYGSIFEWVNQGKLVYDSNGKETKKVHAYNKNWGQWLTKGEKIY